MRSSSRRFISVAAAVAPIILAGCGDKATVNTVPLPNAEVAMQDECDPASFNAALGAGTCTRAGSVTFDQFNAELASTQRVAAWRFVPATLTLHAGQAIHVMNNGGEIHTFTEVENFGGGIVPALNTASGNLIVAPECQHLVSSDSVSPGAAITTDAETTIGTENYQCCIHPWMRATVTVTP